MSIFNLISRSAQREANLAGLQVAMTHTQERLSKAELRIGNLERELSTKANTMTGDDYEAIAERVRKTDPIIKPGRVFMLRDGETFDELMNRIQAEEAAQENTLLAHFDGMPKGDQLWALIDILERREVVFAGIKLSRKNLYRIRNCLKMLRVNLSDFAKDPS